jgi:hypothetical protein
MSSDENAMAIWWLLETESRRMKKRLLIIVI